MRWVRRIGLGLVVLVGLAIAFVHTPWGRNLIRGLVEDELSGLVNGRVTVGAFEGSIFGEPVLRDVRLFDADGRLVATVARAKVDPDLWALVSGDGLPVHAVVVSEPTVWLDRDLGRLAKKKKGGGGGASLVDELVVRGANGTLHFEGETLAALDLDGTLHLGPAPRIEVRSATGTLRERAVTAKGTVTIGDAVLVDGGKVTIGESSVTADLDAEGRVSFVADARAADVPASWRIEGVPRVTANGTLAWPLLSATIEAAATPVGPVRATTTGGDVVARRGAVDLQVGGNADEFAGAGIVRVDAADLDRISLSIDAGARLRTRDIDWTLERASAVLARRQTVETFELAAASALGHVEASGPAPLAVAVRGLDLASLDVAPYLVTGEAQVEDGRARADAVFTGRDGSTIHARATGRVPADPRDARAWTLELVDEATVAARRVVLPVGRLVTLEGRIARKAGGLTGSASARVDRIPIPADVTARLDGDRLSFHARSAKRGTLGALEATGVIGAPRDLLDADGWRRARLRSADVDGRDVEVAALLAALRRDAGWARGVRLSRVHATLREGRVTADGAATTPHGDGTFALTARVPDVRAIASLDDRALETARVDASGPLPGGHRGSFEVKVRLPAPGAPIAVDAHVVARAVELPVGQRTIDATAHLEVGETETRARAVGAIVGLTPAHGRATVGAGRAALREGDLDAFLRAPIDAFAATGILPAALFTGRATVKHRFTGVVRAEGTVEGSLADPIFVVTADAAALRLDDENLGQLTATWRRDSDGDCWVTARGHQPEGELKVRLRGAVLCGRKGGTITALVDATSYDLGALGLVAHGQSDWIVALEGRLDADDLSATGRIDAPSITGSARISKGRLHLRDWLPLLEDVDVKLGAWGRRVVFAATARSRGKGKLSLADGSATLDGWLPRDASATVKATQLPVKVDGLDHPTSLQGKLTVKRRHKHWTILAVLDGGGEIRVPAGGDRQFDTGPLADVKIKSTRPAAPRKPSDEVLDVYITTARGPITVRRSNVLANVGVDLHIHDSSKGLRLRGSVASTGGKVTFLSNTYQIERANADFTDDSMDPELDIELRRQFREVALVMLVTGRLSSPQIELRSDPPVYSQDQLLAIVMGSDPGRRPDTGVAPTWVDSGVNAAAGLLIPEITGRLGIKTKITVGVDSVEGHATAKRYRFGMWLNDSVYLGGRHRDVPDLDENTTEGVLEIYLTTRAILELVAGDEGKGSADIFWVWRY